MHSLNQLPANPVAQSHILILITAQVWILTSISHGVFPPISFKTASAIFCLIYLFAQPMFVKFLLHDDDILNISIL